MRDYRHIALIIAACVAESGKTRLRISKAQFRRISGRSQVKRGLITNVRDWLEDFGVAMFENSRGGYALVSIESLEGAPPIKLNALLPNWRTIEETDLLKIIGHTDADEAEDGEDE
ncbi:hypothetical protein HGI47_18655 [Novosphingobium sp. ERN07]|uniref:hypothetical protein n=1 Tax=Novosphingobium sp. ERN07 TaxID=2726187 RepID=UPI0014576A5C|nr:hypothetical protein [Novosphingobium sp. ERN07]NLR72900.1 hypothetical protein [Novosphingobium sp. ERN07]